MYYGKRDPEVRLLVATSLCTPYYSKNGEEFTECFVPPEHIAEYETQYWGSLMANPHNVRLVNPQFNLVLVNDGAEIQVSVKDSRHVPIQMENLTPDKIIGRYLKYERYIRFRPFINVFDDLKQDLDRPSYQHYLDYKHTNLRIDEYINRMPMYLPK